MRKGTIAGNRGRSTPGGEEEVISRTSVAIPRILIAGTHSGCGKTTISRGIMQALAARGLIVQPFKVGPDFIDPTHHTAICSRPSRNLDPFMMGGDGVKQTFASASRGADIAVIEGVMGLFDGLDGTVEASTADVAGLLSAPVLLVVDAKGMSASANALIRGYSEFDPALAIRGVIFNRIGSERHRELIERTREANVLGWVKRRESLAVGSRHLGLHMAAEVPPDNAAGDAVSTDCDLDAILETAGSAPVLSVDVRSRSCAVGRPRIGVAQDEAFCFYYEDNLDRLRSSGAEIVSFSPVHDTLPDVNGLYLGGGYPELHAAALEKSPCRSLVKSAAEAGMPIYGECGGLLYLSESITAGNSYAMAGVLPSTGEMTGIVQALGYSAGVCIAGNSFFREGMPVKGHEFHYSRLECSRDARFSIRLERGSGIGDGRDGLSEHNVTGCYTHSYFTDEFACSFVRAAALFGRR
ncbi:MAG TPA: cobyrinate a,c-diamide synthase [Methanoregulaceae archaeon]|nr:cobyrinate a,c-diamide synthase [Methanoregulaceae archaeon]